MSKIYPIALKIHIFHYSCGPFRSYPIPPCSRYIHRGATQNAPTHCIDRGYQLAWQGKDFCMVQTSASFRRGAQDADGSISLSEIISALSYALDLTEGAVHGHALRSCLMGMRIAQEAKLPSEQTNGLYFALLLKDIGCSRSASRMSKLHDAEGRTAKAILGSEAGVRPRKPNRTSFGLLWNNVAPVVRAARF